MRRRPIDRRGRTVKGYARRLFSTPAMRGHPGGFMPGRRPTFPLAGLLALLIAAALAALTGSAAANTLDWRGALALGVQQAP